MKKKIISVLAALSLTAALACPALAAAWQPSKTVQGAGGGQATVRPGSSAAESGAASGSAEGSGAAEQEEAVLEVVSTPRTGSDGKAENVKSASAPYIKVTPHAETQAANDEMDTELPELRYAEKAGENTDTGLSYSDNDHVNLVYETVTKSTSTTEFLEKVGRGLLDKVTEAVQTLAEDGEEADVDDYIPAALFDVTASAGAIELMGEDGSVDVELKVPGITSETKLVALHFLGDLEDIEATREALDSDFANTVLEYDAEILPSVPGDGTVTVTMTSFSPVMILTKAEPEPEATAAPAGTEATPEPSAEPTAAPEPEADNGGSGWLWALIVAAAAAVGGGAYAVTRKKKTATTAGKK